MHDQVARESRTFRDEQGNSWLVFERRRHDERGEHLVLIFESDSVIRCVRRYPEHWRELSPEMLERLSWQV